MTLSRVQPGDPLRAADQNRLIDQVNRLGRPAAPRGQFGSTGMALPSRESTRLALFEITGTSWSLPDLSDLPTSTVDREQIPSIAARRIDFAQHETGDVDGSDDPVGTYAIGDNLQETIYYVSARVIPAVASTHRGGYAVGPIELGFGDRVWCVLNRQSGRWEVVGDRESSWLLVYNSTSEDIPPRGIVRLAPNSGAPSHLGGSVSRNTAFPQPMAAINGPSTIPAGGHGLVTLAMDVPALALFDTSTGTVAANSNRPCGVGVDSYSMFSGLPGFRVVSSSAYSSYAWVLRDDASLCTGRLASTPPPAYPTHASLYPVSTAGTVYDGTTLPSITGTVEFFGASACRDLNLAVDDEIAYRMAGLELAGLVAIGDYWDDPIGTVKIWIGTESTIPRGWRVYSALEGKFPRSDDETSPTASATDQPSASLTTYQLTLQSGTGVQLDYPNGVDVSEETNLPPYANVLFIERYQ